MEDRLTLSEDMQAKLQQLNQAQGEEKEKLLAELKKDREKMAAARAEEMRAISAPPGAGPAMGAPGMPPGSQPMPPQMAALQAKSEERRKQMDQLKETLAKASPQDRAKILEDWRKKQAQEVAPPSPAQNNSPSPLPKSSP